MRPPTTTHRLPDREDERLDENQLSTWLKVEMTAGGELRSPDGELYRRTPMRVKRAECRELVEAGTPVVTFVYPEGWRWYVGAAARSVWGEISPRLLAGPPPARRDLAWTAHRWMSGDGRSILVFQGTH